VGGEGSNFQTSKLLYAHKTRIDEKEVVYQNSIARTILLVDWIILRRGSEHSWTSAWTLLDH